MALWAVVIAGGAGTRFWPASTPARPKQLLALGPGSDEPLLLATTRRLRSLVPEARLVVATGAHLGDATRALLPDLPPANLLAEPAPRNTAACIGWAAREIEARDPDAVVCVFPADHAVRDLGAFLEAARAAAALASEGRIVTIGLAPTRPETGYGYIELGEPLPGHARAREVTRFVEKPSREVAEEYVRGGRHLWNGGLVVGQAARMRAAIAAHLPALAEGLDELQAARGRAREEALSRVFPSLPSISIDHGVMERERGLAVVPGDFGWSDVGSWLTAWELAEKDARGNATGGAVVVDSERCLVRSLTTGRPRAIALVGVEDLVVVETDDALLVVRRDRAEDVKLAVDALRARAR
ncbi:MAG: mannose-1-phosphate guanylyltransferase [Polyangiaceae bacterium]|nr:mannose-1-phosphate guanylyltransferase [Polyangiaceae bacterium]